MALINFTAKGEEQVPRIDTADVDQGILEDRSKDEDVQVGINAVSVIRQLHPSAPQSDALTGHDRGF